MREFHVLVLGATSTARMTDAIVDEIRAHGVSAWSERLGRNPPDEASLAWADAIILVDPTPDAARARAPIAWPSRPRLLVASSQLTSDQRAQLLDAGFDYVVPADWGVAVVATFTARLLPRGAFSNTGEDDALPDE